VIPVVGGTQATATDTLSKIPWLDADTKMKVPLPETNGSHLKIDGWNTTFLLGRPIFRGELLVSGRVHEHTSLWEL